MKFILLLLLGLTTQLAIAGEKEFIELCKRVDELPGAQKTTMKSLIRIGGSSIFKPDVESCDEALAGLKKMKHLEMRGAIFGNIFVDSLTPIITLDWIESLSIANQAKVKDITPLQKMNLKAINIQGTNVTNLDQLDKLASLEKISVDVNNQGNLIKLSKVERLKDLIVNFPNLDSINFNALAGLADLQSLEITVSTRGFTGFALKSLDSLTNLTSLTVKGGHVDARDLVSLPLKNLILDGIHGTKISHIDHIGLIDGLEKLSLSHQAIEDIRFLRNLGDLRNLKLNNNKITSAREISGLTKLEELDLSFNEVWIDSEFKELINLRKLNLFSNRFSFFKAETLAKLESLNLGRNNLHEITFKHHPSLTEVVLNKNQLRSHLVGTMVTSSLPVIEILNLSSNKLTSLKDIGTLVTLKRLELNDNKIISIAELSDLKRLERMMARYNLLEKDAQICPVNENGVCDFLHQEI